MAEQRYCEHCRRTKSEINFYQYRDGTKCELCKECLTLHVNNWQEDTFLWLLEKFDVPYIKAEWDILRDKAYAKDPYKMTGMTVFGKYLAKMRLNQFKTLRWADTERLKIEAEERAKLQGAAGEGELNEQAQNVKAAYERGEISEAQYKTFTEAVQPKGGYVSPYTEDPTIKQPPAMNSAYPVNDHPFETVELADVGAELTDDDKVYLAMKWGRLYKADEWVALENFYNEMMQSFTIEGAARIDTLKMICKTSLKMNQAIDCGDVESFQKLSRVYDSMMKAAKFTEAQNKEEKAGSFDSIGEIVRWCEEKGGFIPRHKIEVDLDIADKDIRDMKAYTKSLIEEDTAVFKQIEQYIKKREILAQQEADEKAMREAGAEYIELTDDDFNDYHDHIEEQRQEDSFIKED